MDKKKLITLIMAIAMVFCIVIIVAMLRTRRTTEQAGTEANTRALVYTVENMTAQDLNDALSRFRQTSDEDAVSVLDSMPRFTGERVKLVFTGTGSAAMMETISTVLDERNLSGSFFFTEGELRSSQKAIETLLEHEMDVGLLYDNQAGSMASSSGEDLVSSLCSLSFLFRAGYNLIRVPIMSREMPTVIARRAAAACGFSQIVVTTAEISLDDCTSEEISSRLLLGVKRGDIIRVHLDAAAPDVVMDNLTFLLDALAQTNARVKAQQRLAVWTTDIGLAYPLRRVDTTEEGAIFSFMNLGNKEELNNVLTTLKEIGGKGLFYVTLDEAVHEEDTVRQILADNHDLGIYVPDIDSPTAEEYLTEMIACEEEIQLQYGYSYKLPVFVPDDQEFNLLKAAAAGGFSLATSYLFPVRPQDTRMVDDETEIMVDILSNNDRTINRGELVHFEMEQFIYSNEMTAKLVRCFANQRCVYPIKAYHSMINNTLYTYTYDGKGTGLDIIPNIKLIIHRGQLRETLMEKMQTSYIGSPWYSSGLEMTGFTESEIKSVNNTGIISGSNMVFLTFNDADKDAFVTPLLHVLKKHNVKATFFIRTETADWNPNLMRAIAEDGHAIAIRADSTFNTVDSSIISGSQENVIQNRELALTALQKEFKEAYDTLVNILGDIRLANGLPALTNFFRPTLDTLSRTGMNAAFDSGFSWIIGGNYLNVEPVYPGIYDDEDAQMYWIYASNMLSDMVSATKSGAVLSISYVNDDLLNLPLLIDQYLTSVEGKFRFGLLSDVLPQ